jgi:hypothetical protein
MLSVAVISKEYVFGTAVGVPLIAPCLPSTLSPAGSVPLVTTYVYVVPMPPVAPVII